MFSIYDGRKQFYQWDTDRKLIINDKTISEVHFANCLCSEARKCIPYAIGDLLVVDVPNQLLTEYQDIRVWGYDSGMTKHDAVFEVEKRTKPADYIYTPEEVRTWEELAEQIEAINDIVSALPTAFEMLYEQFTLLDERITALETGKEIIYFNVEGEQYHTISGTTWKQYLANDNHRIVNRVCDNCGGNDFNEVHNEVDGMPHVATECKGCHRRHAYRIISTIEGEPVLLDEAIRAEDYDLLEVL